MSGKFALGTDVPVGRTVDALTTLVRSAGAKDTLIAHGDERSIFGFRMRDRSIRFVIPTPRVEDFKRTDRGVLRSDDAAARARAAEERRLWRALYLVVKAKLEAAESGVVSFEEEFFAHTVATNGRTFADLARSRELLFEADARPAALAGMKP